MASMREKKWDEMSTAPWLCLQMVNVDSNIVKEKRFEELNKFQIENGNFVLQSWARNSQEVDLMIYIISIIGRRMRNFKMEYLIKYFDFCDCEPLWMPSEFVCRNYRNFIVKFTKKLKQKGRFNDLTIIHNLDEDNIENRVLDKIIGLCGQKNAEKLYYGVKFKDSNILHFIERTVINKKWPIEVTTFYQFRWSWIGKEMLEEPNRHNSRMRGNRRNDEDSLVSPSDEDECEEEDVQLWSENEEVIEILDISDDNNMEDIIIDLTETTDEEHEQDEDMMST